MAKILVVDDSEFMRIRIARMLTTEGHHILEAEDGSKAVETYKAAKPDVVLMDITMPRLDGLCALREIRAFDEKAKVVMLTALGQESIVLEAVKAGAKDFIVKPFEQPRVLSTINKLTS
jgi:two-component system chemotaxis response regulator CheY